MTLWASLVAQMVKCLPIMQETQVLSLDQEDPLEKEMAIHSSTLAWKIPWMEEPGGLQSMGSQGVGRDWVTSLSSFFLFFGIGMKTDLFQSCGHCWVFKICWGIECITFTASYLGIWNSSTGIPLPPLALFIVMLPKAHLTSHSRMSGSQSVITPSWLSGSWRSFLYSSSVYSCHLFLISSASVRSIPFLSFIKPIFAWNVPLVLWFSWRDL